MTVKVGNWYKIKEDNGNRTPYQQELSDAFGAGFWAIVGETVLVMATKPAEELARVVFTYTPVMGEMTFFPDAIVRFEWLVKCDPPSIQKWKPGYVNHPPEMQIKLAQLEIRIQDLERRLNSQNRGY